MDAKQIFDHLAAKVGDAVSAFTTEGTKDPYFKVTPAKWLDVAKVLKSDPELAFDFLNNVTAVDWLKQGRIDMVYHLWSYSKGHGCVVKAELPRDKPQIASVYSLWKAADWNEREQFDLFGVEFLGHPDLRRIMLPDDWPGHPMRKDYKEAEAYRGMPTTRPNTLELLPMYDKATPDQKAPQREEQSDE
ncbi:MAG TPA: NADH-quinone oxidoreductase subunit C [Polyangia bacterium]|nr:NADH-quinone oxidoreductase subunit C [Polyangia bacterium]